MTTADADTLALYLAKMFPTATAERVRRVRDRLTGFVDAKAVRECINQHRDEAPDGHLIEAKLYGLIRSRSVRDYRTGLALATAAKREANQASNERREAERAEKLLADRSAQDLFARVREMEPREVLRRRSLVLDRFAGRIRQRLDAADPFTDLILASLIDALPA